MPEPATRSRSVPVAIIRSVVPLSSTRLATTTAEPPIAAPGRVANSPVWSPNRDRTLLFRRSLCRAAAQWTARTGPLNAAVTRGQSYSASSCTETIEVFAHRGLEVMAAIELGSQNRRERTGILWGTRESDKEVFNGFENCVLIADERQVILSRKLEELSSRNQGSHVSSFLDIKAPVACTMQYESGYTHQGQDVTNVGIAVHLGQRKRAGTGSHA